MNSYSIDFVCPQQPDLLFINDALSAGDIPPPRIVPLSPFSLLPLPPPSTHLASRPASCLSARGQLTCAVATGRRRTAHVHGHATATRGRSRERPLQHGERPGVAGGHAARPGRGHAAGRERREGRSQMKRELCLELASIHEKKRGKAKMK